VVALAVCRFSRRRFAVALVLSSIRSFFLHHGSFYELRPPETGALGGRFCLLLLFNGWMLYWQWSFRRERRQLAGRRERGHGRSGSHQHWCMIR